MSNLFKTEVYQNQCLPQGAREVHAIVTVTAQGAAVGGGGAQAGSGGKMFGIICDVSGSMDGEKIHCAKEAILSLLPLIPPDVYFFIVAGSDKAILMFPAALATDDNKKRAAYAVRSIRTTASSPRRG